MIYVIIAIVVIVGIFCFKYFDREFIKAVPLSNKQYHLHFESEKEAKCDLVDIIKYNDKDYYIFIPVDSIKKVPLEDVIILKLHKKKADSLVFVFADEQADDEVLKSLTENYKKNKYGNRYYFDFLN